LKNFNKENVFKDLNQQPWANVYHTGDPNDMWRIWKLSLMEIIDKHAPTRSRRISNKKSPRITNELRHSIGRQPVGPLGGEKSGNYLS
jgi:hypothetical protein